MNGKLYVVGTPIGNLSDFSPRAIETLRNVDFIAAEDTRVTLKLLNKFEIKTPMISYHEHNMRERGEFVCERIENGENCAIVTDAGMPAVSDPGEKLVMQCAERGITFEGFLSMNKKSRHEHLLSLRNEHRTMVFYEAPHKLSATLKDMAQTFGNRRVSIVRELTKVHEEVIRTTLPEAYEKYGDGSLKGEIVLVIEGAPIIEEKEMTLEDAVSFAKELMESGSKPSEAAKKASELSGIKKADIYKEIV